MLHSLKHLVPLLTALCTATAFAQPITDSFTYQGSLQDNGSAANGLYDMNFILYDAMVGGSAIPDASASLTNVEVVDGLFEVLVDFGVSGAAFDSDQMRFLEIQVAPAGSLTFDILPRRPITPTPLANYALRSGTTLDAAYRNGNTIFADSGPLTLRSTGPQSTIFSMGEPGEANPSNVFEMYNQQGDRALVLSTTPLGQATSSWRNRFGSIAARFGADNVTDGGFLSLSRTDSGSQGILLDGNYNSTERPRMWMFSPNAILEFNFNSSNNDEIVELPVDAINATEQLNEPGAAETVNINSVGLINNPALIDIIASVTINAPADGYALVMSAAEVTIGHDLGVVSRVNIGVADSVINFDPNTDIKIRLHEGVPTGIFTFPASSHALYPVNEGANTFYLLADKDWFGGFANVEDTQITAVYLPTAYGNASAITDEHQSPKDATYSASWTQEDIRNEQISALRADNERQQRELDEMRLMIENLRRESEREIRPAEDQP